MDEAFRPDREGLHPGGCQLPQYEGEDARLTSRKELAGWYSYGFAAEVFAICAMGEFPVSVVEQSLMP